MATRSTEGEALVSYIYVGRLTGPPPVHMRHNLSVDKTFVSTMQKRPTKSQPANTWYTLFKRFNFLPLP